MEALRFNGSGSEYFKIWIVNILLTIITLGLYYPWAKVRTRRYFYGNTTLSNRNFEYHATGKQLFVGFLIAMIFFIIYSFLGQVNPPLALSFLMIFLVALPWLIWRSLMFNMKVTSFSNVHFSFKGTLGRSYMIFLGYPLLFFIFISLIGMIVSIMIPSLGRSSFMPIVAILLGMGIFTGYLFLIAFLKKNSTEYLMNGSRYGQGKFLTKVETKQFVILLLKSIGLSIVPVAIVSFFAQFMIHSSLLSNAEFTFILIYFIMIFMMMFVMAFYVIREREYVYKNTIFDDKISFSSTLKARSLAWVMLSNFFLIVVTLGFAFPWAKVRVAKLMLANTLVETDNGFDEYLSQKEAEQSALGEQIGDAFDVDVGVAL